MKYANRADLLEAAAKSIRMQEAAGVEPVCKVRIGICPIKGLSFSDTFNYYEFPLAVVEGKPVFVGDVLYDKRGDPCKMQAHHNLNWKYWSWTKPKPKTVMVELTVEDANHLLSEYAPVTNIHIACRKALENNHE